MNSINKILLVIFLLTSFSGAYSVPARTSPIEITQPDASQITFKLNGDECFNYITYEDSYLIKKTEDGFYKLAVMSDNGIVTVSEFRYEFDNDLVIDESRLLNNLTCINHYNYK